MDEQNVFFLHRIKRTSDVFDKGIEVKNTGTSRENLEAAIQAYHAYLGAYAYGHDANTDFVSCMITDMSGAVIKPYDETWKVYVPEPEPEPESEE
jgi:hypothetical protein